MNDTKVCTKCQQEKPANFEVFTRRGDKLGSHCRECKSKYPQNKAKKRRHYEENKEMYVERSREWAKNNPEKKRESANAWYHRNPEHHVEYQRKRRQDPLCRLVDALRANLYNALNGKGKGQPTLDYLGMEISEFKDYIANKFTEGMSWDNYGEWHIDHIRPISSFDHSDESQIAECWHYSNMQPLWAADNIAKSNR